MFAAVQERRQLLRLVLIRDLQKQEAKKRRRRRRWWVKEHLSKRVDFGLEDNLLKDLLLCDGEDYRNFLRIDHDKFQVLHALVGPQLERRNTDMRDAISTKVRLAICLRFLATGDSLRSLEYLSHVSRSAICEMIPEVCSTIFTVLQTGVFKLPDTPDGWLAIAKDFEKLWHFPHAIGALDGKHVATTAPCNEGSMFFNYKGRHSVVLMALVDAHYNFIYVDIGCNGRISDGGVYKNCTLYTILNSAENLPPPTPPSGRKFPVPYFVLGDETFQLSNSLMKPYPRSVQMMAKQKIYNYRHSRARRIVENAFGILCNRFRVFHRTLNLKLTTVDVVIQCACALHNFLGAHRIPTMENIVVPMDSLVERQGGNNSTENARSARHELADYFLNEGEVAFQWNVVQ